MSQHEIKGLFPWTKNQWLPNGIGIQEKLWWRFMPGVAITVKWPKGRVVLDELPDGSQVSTDHSRLMTSTV